eukprot:CAMPEP_0203636406 /NCGR_PEP_ID=MMETSP0088-20131115/2952_1 /ASSEMBLY_ACC=CAM_ASM_001087 /TAXON_ID=426623 /ORGANISM="Chaetoceros affinis, Strain CCMP159" /LENGTH=487 /DNA_ID=CAMNT_0050490525 /DNA_START=357 /DNA_END=1820 /DNA_ORIENTATION=-
MSSSSSTTTRATILSNNRQNSARLAAVSNWLVNDTALRDVPNFYPLDNSSKYVNDRPSEIANRISDCCRVMSVQATYDNDLATANLITSEHVEIHITLWKATSDNSPMTIVEAQRRKGDAVLYHKYSQNILSAAIGSFSYEDFMQSSRDEESKVARQSSIIQEIKNEKKQRAEEALKSIDDQNNSNHNVNVNSFLGGDGDDSLVALEIAASLLKKDRMDARQLGMETLCLLTDPSKTGIETALLASKVVLFGSIDAGTESLEDEYMPAEDLGVREAILSLVQFGKLGEYIDFEEEEENGGSGAANAHEEEKEFNALLHNLALAVLANALDVLERHGEEMAGIGSNTASNVAVAAAAAQNDGEPGTGTNANAFLEETKEISKRELLSTLLNVLGEAETKPHDACLSAQCLRSLFQASRKAKRKARDLNAKQIVNTALDVARRTHVKLETETKNIMKELERTDDLDENTTTENNGEEESQEEEDSEHEE